jgi:hypothetical protein
LNLSCDKKHSDDWKAKSIVAIIIGVVDLVAFYIGYSYNSVLLMIVPMSIITFFGVMALSSLHSITSDDQNKKSQAIMRKSLTATLILIYIVILALSLSGKIDYSNIPNTITDNFIYIVITIIGFYFGTKTVNEFLQKWKT